MAFVEIMNHLVKLCFYPSLAFNLVLAKFSGRQWYSKVDDTVILGALPFRWMTKQLVEIEGKLKLHISTFVLLKLKCFFCLSAFYKS